jgi:uncharacterized protein YndB with AHSA1/START domain
MTSPNITYPRTHVETTERELIFTRVFKAPRELVFTAFSTCEHLKRWWGPEGWTLSVCEMDFRPGGTWLYCMGGPDGEESWGKSVYSEITPPERIVYNDYFVDSTGTPVEGMPRWFVTTTFEEVEGGTQVHSVSELESAEFLKSMLEMGVVEGFGQTWDRLEAYLATF